MIARTGLPLSTPNEVAINEVARTLHAEGHVVAVGGEGADELFGGYGPAMAACAAHAAAGNADPAMCQLSLASWVALEGKAAVLTAEAWRGVECDAALVAGWRAAFEEARSCGPDGDPLQAHLRFQRRVNLEGLLGRLDRATMLESVEARTPLADRVVADLAERLPMSRKFAWEVEASEGAWGTKRVLRAAFASALPREVVGRAKASFPLPFRSWLADGASALREGSFARSLFTEAAIETVAREPERLWNLSWPMINVALWGRRWFG
jgi:asparagine synthase (glutamine-hydrolysing)